ncbi:fimbrial protein [Salmonella enterica]|uniref:F4 family fimbrial subunit n=1 Tax=Salmonella enterica TaxID=28901 RepID=UPI00071AE0B6|nr:hypothetical protein [Salmonella enterica]EAA8092511.1 fimbrial protein [Salmonella enterica subsp. enterica serovar Molade]EAN4869922.1 fimbrial protein [Salmonella enterica subsp. enterica serovar Bergen]EBS5942696.1 fimbrial protein [Salmonella enterica subsp. enterica serovar Cerro]EBX9174901.1 fimbrial protein [Salmonella enterica subsp. enterica serovar Kandla]ECI3138322.1 fimbrial protein [Salmonella enterica subsp. enterica]EDQ0198310.1 fimbrial protein [Salmonella enterica subsp. 
MKKTLIALAVAASAVVSGSAMAWTAGGNGGDLVLGGTLSPVPDKNNPWEVELGSASMNQTLNASFEKGASVVDILVKDSVPVLGIRTSVKAPFTGAANITPRIEYGAAVDLSAFADDTTTLTLEVKNNAGQKIGKMVAPFSVGAEASSKSDTQATKNSLIAVKEGDAFFGGLPSNADMVTNGWAIAAAISGEYVANYDSQGGTVVPTGAQSFGDNALSYSGFYGAGILGGKTVKLTFDQPLQSSAPIEWRASLPITVSYN